MSICEFIRESLGAQSVTVYETICRTHSAGVKKTYRTWQLTLRFESGSFTGHLISPPENPDRDDVLLALSSAMEQATANSCHCCGLTKDWPTFERLAADIKELF